MLSSIKTFSAPLFFITLFLLEYWLPQFKNRPLWEIRKFSNMSMTGINFLCGHFFALGFLFHALKLELGLFHLFQLARPLQFLATLILFDLALYAQHLISHKVAFLWRFHRVHHSDLFLDTTSALRFHPGEIIFSSLYKALIGVGIGASFHDYLIFETLLTLAALFNHSNIAISAETNKFIKLFIVTPQMHRIHHSPYGNETQHNFGFGVSWWDKIFKTYREKTNQGPSMTFGEPKVLLKKDLSLNEMITYPFKANTVKSSKLS